MTLTPEERERIYQEEKAKREGQPRLFPETPQPEKKRPGCLGLIAIGFALWSCCAKKLMRECGRHSAQTGGNYHAPKLDDPSAVRGSL